MSWNAFSENDLPLLLLVVAAQLQQHQLPDAVHEIRRIERAALGFAPRARFFHKRLVAEEPHALFDRPVLRMQPDADDEAREPDQRLRELPELDARIVCRPKPASIIISSQ